ncbi:MAG TPA: PQQ-binding-like beta-propeller repeat protein [Steroidobacteraceae bacterium]|nr:PQQ-binding-like beta-propeller repeat protein [Steroidobacteraceae bacterium]
MVRPGDNGLPGADNAHPTGVYTYHNDLARDGVDDLEYILSPSDVNRATFGKLFSCSADGAIYAQPLVARVRIGDDERNVVFVATEHDGLYAFDTDQSPCRELWKEDLIDTDHGGLGGETTVPAGTRGYFVGKGYGDITPEVGVTGTPVIDPGTDTLYVVSKSVIYSAGVRYYQRLHAIDLATGAEKPGSPVTIDASYPGKAEAATRVAFDARQENQRSGLALVQGTVYVAFASHEDARPYYGWLIGYRYDGRSFARTCVFNTAPDTGGGGIWMSGMAPAAGPDGDLYVVTANADFDATSPKKPNDDYGDSFLKLSHRLTVLQYFTPSDEAFDDKENNDFGAGGVVLANLPADSRFTRIALAGGKDGKLFVLDRDAPGGFGDARALQEIKAGTETDLAGPNPGVIFSAGALWDDEYFLAGAGSPLQAYRLDPATGRLTLQRSATQPAGGFGYPGGTPSISAKGAADGVVWVLDNRQYCTAAAQGCGRAVLYAYDAADLRELWNSSLSPTDAAGHAVKFAVPTIANGKVYVGTRGNNTGGRFGSTSVSGELDVYGLKSR